MLKSGADLIAEERKRQIEKEGWTSEHDDEQYGALAIAGASYAMEAVANYEELNKVWAKVFHNSADLIWPYDKEWWKPTLDDPIRQLVKAGALIAAEIDRLQRKKLDDGLEKLMPNGER